MAKSETHRVLEQAPLCLNGNNVPLEAKLENVKKSKDFPKSCKTTHDKAKTTGHSCSKSKRHIAENDGRGI
jgi:hypothetical protein